MEGEVKKVDTILQDHEKRIVILEHGYQHVNDKLTSLESSMLRVENTVMREGQEQRSLIKTMLENQFKLNKSKLTSSEKVKIALITTLGTILGGGAIVGIVSLFIK